MSKKMWLKNGRHLNFSMVMTSILLTLTFPTVTGNRCCDPGTGGCCGTGYSVDCTCSQCCDIDTAAGIAAAIVITLAVGLPLFIIAGIALCCCFCPGCPGYKSRGSQSRRNPTSTVIMQGGLQNFGFYDPSAGHFNVNVPPNDGHHLIQNYEPGGGAIYKSATSAVAHHQSPPNQRQTTQHPPPPPYSSVIG